MVPLLLLALVVLGVVIPLWWCVLAALGIAVFRGYVGTALMLAVCADLFYGHPTGIAVSVPFTLFTAVALCLRFFLRQRMRRRPSVFL